MRGFLAEDFCGRVAGKPSELGIDVFDRTRGVGDDDRGRALFDPRNESLRSSSDASCSKMTLRGHFGQILDEGIFLFRERVLGEHGQHASRPGRRSRGACSRQKRPIRDAWPTRGRPLAGPSSRRWSRTSCARRWRCGRPCRRRKARGGGCRRGAYSVRNLPQDAGISREAQA